MRAADILRRGRLVSASPGEPIKSAAVKMHRENVGSVLVMEDGKLVGIFTERDLVRAVAENASLEAPIERYMSRDLVTARPDEPLPLIASKMIERGIRHIPVVEEGRVLGVLSIRDVLRAMAASESWP